MSDFFTPLEKNPDASSLTGFTGNENEAWLPTPEELLAEGERIAAEHFEEETILNQPSVVFEFGRLSLQSIFPSEKYKSRVTEALESSRLQLVNFWGIEHASHAHSLMYLNLERVKYSPMPATICLLPEQKEPSLVGQPNDCPLWVRKQMVDAEGESLAHRGRGISFIYPENIKGVLPRSSGEFFQQFVMPPDGFIKDIRTYIVGDQVIPGHVRKAKKPITDRQLRNREPITRDQFVSAQNPGETLPLVGDLAEQAVSQARKFREAMDKSMTLNRPFLKDQPIFGFGSVDFLINQDGELLVNDFDVGPSVGEKFGVSRKVAKAFADYLGDLSRQGGGTPRKIYIFSEIESKFMQRVQAILLQSIKPKLLVFKDSLELSAYKSLSRKELSK